MADKLIGNADPNSETTETEETSTEATEATTETSAEETTETTGLAERPENVPEQFWNAETGSIDTDALLNAHIEVTKPREGVPETPDGYTVTVSEGLAPEGLEITIDEKDPLLAFWREMAHKSGATQEDFDAGVRGYLENTVANIPNIQEELGKLGENGRDRVTAVDNWLASKLPDNLYTAIAESPFSQRADFVEAMETLMGGSREKTPGKGATSTGGKLTENDLKEMMKDERYWRHRDPAYIKQVSEGFAALFPGDQVIDGTGGNA